MTARTTTVARRRATTSSRTVALVAAALAFALGATGAWGSDAEPGSVPEVAEEAAGQPATQATVDVASPGPATGPYVAVSGGLALGNLARTSVGGGRRAPTYDIDTVSGSIGLRAGWRLHPRLAAELLWDYQTGWDFEVGADDATATAWNLTVNAKAWLTESTWRPFLTGGFGLGRRETDSRYVFFDPNSGMTSSIHDTDQAFVARVGGGMDVLLGEAWSVGLEVVYVLGTGDLDSLDYATTSFVLAYQFL